MDAKDARIAKILELKVLHGFTVKEIAAMLNISESYTYHFLDVARAIGKVYRKNMA